MIVKAKRLKKGNDMINLPRRKRLQLYRYKKRQHYRRERRNIYRSFHEGELDTKIKEFDKKWTKITLIFCFSCIAFILLTIFLSGFLGLSEQALIAIYTVGVALIVNIMGVLISYKTKAYKGKKAQEDNLLERDKLGLTNLKEKVTDIFEDVVEDTTGREG